MVSPDTRLDKGQVREADAGAFYRERDRKAVREEAQALMQAQGAYTPAKWANRWDFVTAGYLAYYVSYAGTQADPEGFIYKSAREMYEETGITPDQQKRSRNRLLRDGVIEAEKKGIGNKWNVRVNIPFLRDWDEMDERAAQVEAEEQARPRKPAVAASGARGPFRDHAEPLGDHAEPLRDNPEPFRAFPQTHNRNTQKHAETTLSRRREKKEQEAKRPRPVDGKLSRCLSVLEAVPMSERDREKVADLLPGLMERFPRLDPVAECRKVVDYGSTTPIRSVAAFLPGHFERSEDQRAAEPPNPHGAGSEVFVAPEKDRTQPRVDPRLAIRLIREGVPEHEAWQRATVYPEDEAA